MSVLSLRARFSYLLIVINSWFKSAVITLKSAICSNSRDCMTLVFLIEVNTGVYLHSGDILINLGNAICRSSSPSSYAQVIQVGLNAPNYGIHSSTVTSIGISSNTLGKSVQKKRKKQLSEIKRVLLLAGSRVTTPTSLSRVRIVLSTP